MGTFIFFIRYVILLVFAVLLTAYYLIYTFVPIYEVLFPNEGGGFGDIDLTSVAIIFVSLQFYIPSFFIALGDKNRYWAFGIILILLLLVDYQIDSYKLPVFLFVILSGAGLGWLIRLTATHTLGKMAVLEPYKKFF